MYQRTRPSANQTNSAVTTTTTYSFDYLHRLTGISYSDSTAGASYYYDETTVWSQSLLNPKGRMTHIERGSTGDAFSYDAMGRILTDWQCTSNCSSTRWNLSRTYDLVGNVTNYTNGRNVTLTQAYDAGGHFTQLTSSLSDSEHPATLVSALHYNALGQLTSGTMGNGVSLSRSYNSRGLPTAISDGSIWSATDITYKPNAAIASANDSQNGNWSYTYDDFNRLKTAAKTGTSFTYVYDRYGNRWQQNGGPGPQPQYTFDANNRIEPGNGISYDAAGNVTNDSSHTYAYDAENRLVSVDSGNTASYIYDADGRRVRVTTSNGTLDFVFDLQGRAITAIRASDGVWARGEIWSPVGYLATYVSGTTYFNHVDWLGSIRKRSTVSGGSAEGYTNLPFGDALSSVGLSPIHFTGQERDTEDNLDHFWFRPYSSMQGRWMSPDPAGLGSAIPSDPQTWNRYAYVMNDAVNSSDPLGLMPPWFCNGDNPYECHRWDWIGWMWHNVWGLVDMGVSAEGIPGPSHRVPPLSGETLGIPNGMSLPNPTLMSILIPSMPQCDFGPCIDIAMGFTGPGGRLPTFPGFDVRIMLFLAANNGAIAQRTPSPGERIYQCQLAAKSSSMSCLFTCASADGAIMETNIALYRIQKACPPPRSACPFSLQTTDPPSHIGPVQFGPTNVVPGSCVYTPKKPD